MHWIEKVLLILVISIVMTACILSPIYWYNPYHKESDSCILDESYNITRGRIINTHGHGIFSSGVGVSYQLLYHGKREKSGEACEQWHRVTEFKYDQEMYGRK